MILKRRFFSAGLMHIILIVVSAFAIYPVFMMVAGSFKSPSELLTNVAGLPAAPTWTNYMRLLNYNSGLIVRTYLNSIFISSAYTMLAIFLSSMAGFAFAKYKFKGRELIFLLLLITMMVPPELNLPPQYLMFSRIGWLHTYQVQIIPGVANVFALFMMRQYMQSIPDSLLEAARIDGAGHFTIYRRIVMPTASPAVGALAILLFLSKWNDYLYPKIMVSKIDRLPIMVILPTLNEVDAATAVPWELVLTGSTIVTVPLLILFLLFQNKFISSVTVGAVKG